MADVKPSGASLKKSESEEKKSKKHKRQKSGVLDNNEPCQEKQIVASESTEIPEDVEKGSEDAQSQDSTSSKAKKKSLLRKLSFGKKKKKDRASVTDGDSNLTVESGEAVCDATDEEKFTGTRNTEATTEENSGSFVLQELTRSPVSPKNGAMKTDRLPLESESSQEAEEKQQIDTKSQAEDNINRAVEIEINVTGDNGEDDPQIEIPSDTDIAEGVPRPRNGCSDINPDKLKLIEKEVVNENSFLDTIYVILQHMKELPFGSDRFGHVSEISSETCRLIITAVDKSFSRFESLFNFLLNQAGETTRKIVMFFLAGLIKRYPHCFKVSKTKVKKKRGKSALKSSKAAAKSCQDTIC